MKASDRYQIITNVWLCGWFLRDHTSVWVFIVLALLSMLVEFVYGSRGD